MPQEIEIILNGLKTTVLQGISVTQLLSLVNELDAQVIVECNGKFIFPQEYESKIIENGDKIELINPDFGG